MEGGGDKGELGSRVHQAVGMIAAQLDCTTDEAMGVLYRRAAAMLQSLEHTALDVLDGIIRFDE